MRSLLPLVEPGDDDFGLRDEVANALEAAGTQRDHAKFLGSSIVLVAEDVGASAKAGVSPSQTTASIARRAVEVLEPFLSQNLSHGARVIGAAYRIAQVRTYATDHPHVDQLYEEEVMDRLVRALLTLSPPIDFYGALPELNPDERRPDLDDVLVNVARESGRLTEEQIGDLRHYGSTRLRDFRRLTERMPDEDAGRMIWAAMSPLRDLPEAGGKSDRTVVPSSGDLLEWIEIAIERLSRRPDDQLILGSLWIAALKVEPGALTEGTRRRILELAQRRLAYLRKDEETVAGRRGPPWDGDSRSWDEQVGHDQNAFAVVARLGGHWKAVKAGLLLLRALRQPSVSPDLRYFMEKRDHDGRMPGSPPARRWIPDTIATLFHRYATEEAANDTDLVRFRSEFARYCLDRLRSRHGDKSIPPEEVDAMLAHIPEATRPFIRDAAMLESSPEWRRAYIRAFRELRVNPGGSGHQVLHWAANNDPHDALRGEAATAYGEVVRRTLLAPGVTPRRALFNAFWYLRQVHCQLTTGRFDEDGAKSTREKEKRKIWKLDQEVAMAKK